MRNDAHDEIDELPSLSAARAESPVSPPHQYNTEFVTAQPLLVAPQSNKGLGVLSALTLALLCASGTFAWWSMQRIQLLEQQLVATQNSFSRISEDAAGRIKDITGKFTATESSVLNDNEVLKMRLNKIESAAVEAAKQQQIYVTEHTARLTKLNSELLSTTEASRQLRTTTEQQQQIIEQQKNALSSLQKDLDTRLSQHDQQLSVLQKNSDTNQQQSVQLAEHAKNLQDITTQLNKLQQNMPVSEDFKRLQQDVLILRSELEQRPSQTTASQQGLSVADFDAFRAQTNRTINALQEQLRNLQKNAP